MRRKPDPVATKKKIFEAVVALSRQIGIENITFQNVAKKAGVSYYGVHYHFGQKEKGLTLATIEYVGSEAQKYIATRLESRGTDRSVSLVDEYIRGTFDWAKEMSSHAVLWAYYYYLCSAEGAFRAANQMAVEKARMRIVSLLAEDIGRGHFSRLQEIEQLATKIHQQVVGGVIGYLTDSSEASFGTHRKAVLEAVRDFIQAHSRFEA